jgi:Tol biopolymer transport system component
LTTTPLGFSDSALGYAPNGRHILFFRENLTTFTSTLYVVRADGSHPVRLSPKSVGVLDLDFNDGAAGSWAPDSSHVAFAGIAKQGGGTATGLYVVGIDGRGFTRITPPGMGALSASWSPTGSWIAYSSNLHGDTQVYISHPDGSGRRQLTYPVGGYAIGLTPMWSPDGRWLLFQRGYWKGDPVSYDLAIVGIAGGAITHVADLPGWTSYRWGTAPPTN